MRLRRGFFLGAGALALLAWAAGRSMPAQAQTDALAVTATVDVTARGTPISPYIYGAAMGDRKEARELGLTILRAGGNEVSPLDWRTGFNSKGADWFFENFGERTPPEKNWLITFFGDNKRDGLETYLTMPCMGRVAKDGSSVAFDIRKFPNQESWAGKVQQIERLPYAGNGKQVVTGPDGKQQLRDVPANPDDTSLPVTPDQQTAMLSFMIHDMGYGPAKAGGLKYLALDNEPMLWNSTHRGMHPEPMSYDSTWKWTVDYASRLKKIDPDLKIAGPNLWGWTAYYHSALDSKLIADGKGTWPNPPDRVAHGRVPFTRWWLRKLAEYKKRTGVSLVDVLDWHFYPQNGVGLGDGKSGDPATMEARAQETRVLWDPTWKDPSWMGDEVGKVLRIVRLMKEWVAADNPGMKTSIGEYDFGGEKDVSGGVTQAELLGVFAREGLDFAFFWFFPEKGGSIGNGFRIFRNPNGRHTVFGDRYLPSTCSAPDDVSVHAARDSKSGRLSLVLVNKRARRAAGVAVKLSRSVPAQSVTPYAYGAADPHGIAQLPAMNVSGDRLTLELPAMSVLRIDLKP